jgi:hypothetical protein
VEALGEPEILDLQRSAGNGSVAGLLARAPLVVQRAFALADGGSVGDGGTNTREQVSLALDRLFSLWSVSNEDYSTATGAIKGLPAGSAVASDNAAMPILIAGLTKNEEASLSKEVGTTQLGVGLTGSIGSGKSNARTDILGAMDALHNEWHLSNEDYTTERAAVMALAEGASVADSLIPKTISGIARLKAAVVKGTPKMASGGGGATAAGGAAASGGGTPAAPVSGSAFSYRKGVADRYSVKADEKAAVATADQDVADADAELAAAQKLPKSDPDKKAKIAAATKKKADAKDLKARDEIERVLAKKGTTPGAWYGQIVNATFLGVTISNGVHEQLATKLRAAEDDLLVTQGLKKEDLGLSKTQGTDGLRVPKLATGGTKVSLHCYGLAVDLNYANNPYIGLEKKGGTGDAIKHATLLVTGTETDMLDKTQRKAGEAYDALKAASDAFKQYLGLRGNKEEIGKKAKALRDAGTSSLSDDEWVALIEKDWANVTSKAGDFAPTHNPLDGFLDFDKRVVLALTKAGLNWLGAQGGAKDVMHFQLDGVMPR